MANRILIIEDNPSLIKAIKAKFVGIKYQVSYAMDGEEGIELFDSIKPDLVLLDIAMPKKNGLEVLEYIRSEANSEVPVIIFSNFKEPDKVDAAEKLGIECYILKADTSLAELVSNVNKILS